MSEKKYKALIVDDDQFLLDIYSTKFKEEGFEVDIALGGEEALDKLTADDSFNIVLMDLVMPGMDGLALLEAMKKAKLNVGRVLIVLSNQGQPTDIKQAEQQGIHGYIVKASTIPSEVVHEVVSIADKILSK